MEDDPLRPESCPGRELGLVWGMLEHRNLEMLLGYAASNIFINIYSYLEIVISN